MTPGVATFPTAAPPPESDVEWLTPRYESIPRLLQQYDRWLGWAKNGEGRKVPRAVARPDKGIDAQNANNWSSFAALRAASQKFNGPGFALGPVSGGPTFAGVDIDDCRNPRTGDIA